MIVVDGLTDDTPRVLDEYQQQYDFTFAVARGAPKLVGTQSNTMIGESVRLLEDPAAYEEVGSVENPYGDGKASQHLLSLF